MISFCTDTRWHATSFQLNPNTKNGDRIDRQCHCCYCCFSWTAFLLRPCPFSGHMISFCTNTRWHTTSFTHWSGVCVLQWQLGELIVCAFCLQASVVGSIVAPPRVRPFSTCMLLSTGIGGRLYSGSISWSVRPFLTKWCSADLSWDCLVMSLQSQLCIKW